MYRHLCVWCTLRNVPLDCRSTPAEARHCKLRLGLIFSPVQPRSRYRAARTQYYNCDNRYYDNNDNYNIEYNGYHHNCYNCYMLSTEIKHHILYIGRPMHPILNRTQKMKITNHGAKRSHEHDVCMVRGDTSETQ